MRLTSRTSPFLGAGISASARQTYNGKRSRLTVSPLAYVTTEEGPATHVQQAAGTLPRAGPATGADIKELVAALRAQASLASAQASARAAANSQLGVGQGSDAAALERAAVLGAAAVLHSGRELNVKEEGLPLLVDFLSRASPGAVESTGGVGAAASAGAARESATAAAATAAAATAGGEAETRRSRRRSGGAAAAGAAEGQAEVGGCSSGSGQWNAMDLLLAPYAHLFADMPEQDVESKYDLVAALLRFSPPTGRQKYCMVADVLDAMHRHADAYSRGDDDPWGWLVLHMLGAEVPSKYCPLDSHALSAVGPAQDSKYCPLDKHTLSNVGPASDSKYDMTQGLFHERGPVVMVGQAANGVAGAIDYTARSVQSSIAAIGALSKRIRRATPAMEGASALGSHASGGGQ